MGKEHARNLMAPTKVRIPAVHSDYILRPRLHSRLNSFKRNALGLVVAPAGYGKSCLVSSWANRSSNLVAWLSLSREDASPSRFWPYFCYAIESVLGDQVQLSPNSDSFVESTARTAALDRIAISVAELELDVFLVLDDYHYLEENVDIDASLSYLIENCPQNLHIILISRKFPNLRLTKKRLASQLDEITEEDLAFTLDEATFFLNQKHNTITNRFIGQAMGVTNGWPSGLKLLAMSLSKEAPDDYVDHLPPDFSSDVSDFMFEEVVCNLPPKVQQFALLTSFLDSYCPSLATRVLDASGVSDPEATVESSIEYLLANNIFITEVTDSESEPWFSYHALLRQALKAHALRKGSRQACGIYAAASEWFKQENLFGMAVAYAARAQDHDAIAQVIYLLWHQMLIDDEIATLLEWYGHLPDDYVSQHPKLCLFQALPLAVSADFPLAQKRLEQARKSSKSSSDFYDATIQAIESLVNSLEGESGLAAESAEKALELLPAHETHFRAMAEQVLGSSMVDEDIIGTLGIFEQSVKTSISLNDRNVTCSAYANLSLIEAMIGHARQAGRHSDLAREMYPEHHTRIVPILGIASLADALVAYHSYRIQAASDALQRVMRKVEFNYIRRDYARAQILSACLLASLGKPDEAEGLVRTALELDARCVAEVFPGLGSLNTFLRFPDFVQKAVGQRGVISGQRLPAAHLWLNAALAFCEDREVDNEGLLEQLDHVDERYLMAKVNIGLLIACLYEREGDVDRASHYLMEALRDAQPEQIIQPFIEAVPHCLQTLRQSARQDPNGFAASIYRMLPSPTSAVSAPHATAKNTVVSAREIDVMRFVEQGFSTGQIAERLFISPETVKKHTKHVFAKTGTHSRIQAVNALKERGLL